MNSSDPASIFIGVLRLYQFGQEVSHLESSYQALSHDLLAARPTLETLTPAARPGAVLFIDNATSSAERYRDLNEFLSTPENGWASVVMPFTNGLELAVKVEQ